MLYVRRLGNPSPPKFTLAFLYSCKKNLVDLATLFRLQGRQKIKHCNQKVGLCPTIELRNIDLQFLLRFDLLHCLIDQSNSLCVTFLRWDCTEVKESQVGVTKLFFIDLQVTAFQDMYRLPYCPTTVFFHIRNFFRHILTQFNYENSSGAERLVFFLEIPMCHQTRHTAKSPVLSPSLKSYSGRTCLRTLKY